MFLLGLNPNLWPYLIYSGLGAFLLSLITLGSVFTAAWRLWKVHECQEPGCWRRGHLMADGHTRACWRCHPEGRPRPGHIARRHAEHLARQAAFPPRR